VVRGNPTEVKVVLASVATALAIYQVVLAAIFYRRLRPAFLAAGPAAFTHRSSGDTIAVKVVVIRWWHAAGRFLPALGITVFVLLAATWASTAGALLA
jgi:Family of unknown function (DUF6529)